jgi:hypothetical protein
MAITMEAASLDVGKVSNLLLGHNASRKQCTTSLLVHCLFAILPNWLLTAALFPDGSSG